jgi:hypothetical protein
MKFAKRTIASALLVSMLGLTAPVQAAMLPTEAVLSLSHNQPQRDAVAAFMAREDVRQQLQQLGVDPQQASERVAALSDAEIADLNGKVAELPAAGSDVLGVLLFLFILLLVTDILGLTKVFPFTRSVR